MDTASPHVELGMYAPVARLRAAWEALWAAVHRQETWTPGELVWSGDVHARWRDPNCVVSQACGYPYITQHHHELGLVGAFTPVIDEAVGHRYRSVLIASTDRPLDDLIQPSTRLVANSPDSLSGWVSLLHATVGPTGEWPGAAIEFRGSHHESLRALRRKEADLASIDPWTLALLRDDDPGLLESLHVVGRGPLVPNPPVVARTGTPRDRIAALRAAFGAAVNDPGLTTPLEQLRIGGFVSVDEQEYLALRDLRPDDSPTP